MSFNWTCPYCDRDQTVVDENYQSQHHHIYLSNIKEGSTGVSHLAVKCANKECGRLTVSVFVGKDKPGSGGFVYDYASTGLFSERVYPRGYSRPQPDYIPAALREDYLEACLIRDLSPKASATLARRCVQGMIRDFCGISKGRLIDEIDALRIAVADGRGPAGVTLETIEAIDHVRSIGNIGAHMEKDIDLIVPVDPGEAQALIDLIELLFAEWYVARKLRKDKLAAISRIGADKKQVITDGRAARQALPAPTGPDQSE